MPFGTLPRRDAELVILRVAWRCGCAYEWQQHVPIALRVGLTSEEVAGVADSSAGAFSERQRTLLAVSDELLARRALSDTTWRGVQATLGDRGAIELCLLIGNVVARESQGGLREVVGPRSPRSTSGASASSCRSRSARPRGATRAAGRRVRRARRRCRVDPLLPRGRAGLRQLLAVSRADRVAAARAASAARVTMS
jgi:hypothetical protein